MEKSLKVLVCGGRHFEDWRFVRKCLDEFHSKDPITTIVHGGAAGVDTMAGQWARDNNVSFKVFPAKWDIYGSSAGFIRNTDMANDKPDIVLAFPGGSGTKHMIETAKRKKIHVIEYVKENV